MRSILPVSVQRTIRRTEEDIVDSGRSDGRSHSGKRHQDDCHILDSGGAASARALSGYFRCRSSRLNCTRRRRHMMAELHAGDVKNRSAIQSARGIASIMDVKSLIPYGNFNDILCGAQAGIIENRSPDPPAP